MSDNYIIELVDWDCPCVEQGDAHDAVRVDRDGYAHCYDCGAEWAADDEVES